MEDRKKAELDCSKKCKHVFEDCQASGQGPDQCKARFGECIASCSFT